MTSRRLFAVLLCAALLSGCLLAAAEEAGHDSHDHESPAPSPAPAAEEHAGEEHSEHDHEVAVSPSPALDEHTEEEHADELHDDHEHQSTSEATVTGEVVEEEEGAPGLCLELRAIAFICNSRSWRSQPTHAAVLMCSTTAV